MRPLASPLAPAARRLAAALLVAAALPLGCGAGISQTALVEASPPIPKELFARRQLENARRLRAEGRFEHAASVARRGIEAEPENAALHRLLADVLDELGRTEEALGHRAEADRLDPPPPPLPDEPLDLPSHRVLVVLLAPGSGDGSEAEAAAEPSEAEEALLETLEERLRTRLPQASIRRARAATVASARRWIMERDPRSILSLRVERATCGESIKDGFFALARLRVATAAPSSSSDDDRTALAGVETAQTVLDQPPASRPCPQAAVARALEDALALRQTRAALRAPERGASHWSHTQIRALFPCLGERLARTLERGREALALGQLGSAREHFLAARAIDPEDPGAQAFLHEVEQLLALSRELEANGRATRTRASAPEEELDGDEETEAGPRHADELLAPHFSVAERDALERRLREERRQREELLAALAVLDEDREAPAASTIAAMRPAALRNEPGRGEQLAAARSSDGIEARVLYAPDGSVLARYYFGAGSERPLLREEDTDGDGQPDRWVAYAAGARREVWERGTEDAPGLHLVFAEGGDPLERVELDADRDGLPERIFRYEDGRVASEALDRTGDGRFDRFEHFDRAGDLSLREEDVDGDGQIDVRTFYRSGRLVRREIVNPEVVSEFR